VKGLSIAAAQVQAFQKKSGKPLAVILAGHNGSGKSTLWYEHLVHHFKIPLVNADRMMLSILPERAGAQPLPKWASTLRDDDTGWMRVAQKGVEAFVAQAMYHKVPFATETVFSHWQVLPDGKVESKIDLIKRLKREGYFVLLLFVGLANAQLSIARVNTRVSKGGHAVELTKLRKRFPKTQKAIRFAAHQASATVMVDNSRSDKEAFTVCRVQIERRVLFDRRKGRFTPPKAILAWLDVVAPAPETSPRALKMKSGL
jgi:predicted ABC-type ATPase